MPCGRAYNNAGMNAAKLARWACVGLLAAALLRDVREPFWGLHDFNTADHAQFARVMLRQPASVHHFLATYALGMDRPDPPHHYAHHPPMITWLTAISFSLLGEHEWAARLAPILCSLGGLLIFMRLARETSDETTSLVAGVLFAVTPVGAFFGRMANHEAPTLFFSLLALWGWRGLRDGLAPNRVRTAAWFFGVAGAIYSGWPGTFVAFLIGLDALWSIRPRGRAVAFILWPSIVLAALLMHLVQFGLDGHWDVWWDLLTTRSAGDVPAKQGDDPLRSLLGITAFNFTWPMLALAVVGLMAAVVARFRRVATGPHAGVMWIMLAAGGLHLCFYRQAIIHQYWSFYLWPVVAFLAAVGVIRLHAVLQPWFGRAACVPCGVLVGLSMGWGILNTDTYFSYDTYPRNKVAFWTDPAVARIVPLRSPILLAEPMVAREPHGSYVHWWWGEPATAYYMDRPFRLVQRAAELGDATTLSRWLVVSDEWLERLGDLRAGLQSRPVVYHRWGYRVYDLR